MLLEPGSKLVMIGDSITDSGRAQPVGEGLFEALGRSYVSLVDSLLANSYPERRIRVVNMGNSGNTIRDLKTRWQHDVLDLAPDYVSVMIGTNDVWRQFDSPYQLEAHVGPDEYRETLSGLVAHTKPSVKAIVLMTPFYLEPLREDAMRKRMDEYGGIVREMATTHGTVFVDTQKAFEPLLTHYHSAAFAWDRVHPNTAGHMTIARAFLNAVGFEWNR